MLYEVSEKVNILPDEKLIQLNRSPIHTNVSNQGDYNGQQDIVGNTLQSNHLQDK
jgi:hypothetical protein